MKTFIIRILIIDNDPQTIKKINDYISKFNIAIEAIFETDLEKVHKIIKNNVIDYLFISNKLVTRDNLNDITALLKSSNNKDCIIVFHNISENLLQEFVKNGNFLLPDELSYDLFKKLIGYSMISNTKNFEVPENYKDDFITTHDSLTMLPNRNFLLKKITTLLEASHDNDKKFAIFFLDLDGFKNINDTAGHDSGDLILKEVARRLIKNTRATDIVSRHGGDEFIILLPHIRSRDDVEIVANKLLSVLCEPFNIKQETWTISASIGVATYPEDGTTVEKLIANADTAMYLAKEEGRNCIRYFNKELNEKLTSKLNILNDIRKSIANNEFEILLQPQHELKTNRLCGAEVFVRWNHPQKGIIMPNDFLPYILNTGYISLLGNLILKKALAVNYEIKNFKQNDLIIAINVESRQLINDNLIEHLAGLKKMGVNVKHLAIEITESCFKTNFNIIKKRLCKLRELGVKIYLDDFGLGNSSVTQLIDLPVDIIKIDNKVLTDTSKSDSIKRGIIALSHSFNIKTMAKRIDDGQQLGVLVDLGCDYGQGYCYSKPLTVAQFNAYVREQSSKAA